MLTIDRLSIHLPAGFEGRADSIAALIAERLADVPVAESRTVERLRVDEVVVDATHADTDLAERVAHAIRRELWVPPAPAAPGR